MPTDGVPLGNRSGAHIDEVMGSPNLAISRAELHERRLERSKAIRRRASATFKPGVVFDAWGVRARFGVVPLSTTREIEVVEHDPLPCWHRRSVLVVGDAAHAAPPTSGQVVGRSLEDAWHPRRTLATGCDVSAARTQLFEIRSPKTAAVMEVGRTLARSVGGGGFSGQSPGLLRALLTRTRGYTPRPMSDPAPLPRPAAFRGPFSPRRRH